jgi:DNA-binding NarL/FixJ family response regulator
VRALADGRGPSAADARRRLRSVGVDAGESVTVFVARGLDGPAPALAEVSGRRARGLSPAGIVLDAAATGLHRSSLEPPALRQAFEAAERAALVAHALGRRVVRADETGPFDPVAAAVLAGRQLGPALSPRDERLLEALVDSGFSVAAAARRLGVARQTVYKELQRAETRLGLRPLDPGAQAEISLRLIAHRMQQAVEADGTGW